MTEASGSVQQHDPMRAHPRDLAREASEDLGPEFLRLSLAGEDAPSELDDGYRQGRSVGGWVPSSRRLIPRHPVP